MATTIPISRKTPIIAFEVALAQLARAPGTGTRKVLILGAYDDTITATTVNEPVRPSNELDAAARFGDGRALQRAHAAALDEWRGADVWCVPVAKGAGATSGVDTTIIAGTATETKTLLFRFGNRILPISVPNTTTAAALGPLIVAAITNATYLPITAAGTATVTMTWKDKGVESLHGKWYIDPQSIPAGITFTPSFGTMDVGTVDHEWSAAFAAAFASTRRWTYVVPCTNTLATLNAGTGNLKTRISDAALASVDKRMQVILGHCGIETAAATLADGFDNGTVLSSEPGWRFQVAWAQDQMEEAYVTAARVAARRALEESIDPNANWCGYFGAVLRSSGFLPPPLAASYPLDTDIEAALNAGVTPIAYDAEAQTGRVVLSITTKCTTGTAADFRAMTTNKITVCDVIATDLRDFLGDRFNGFRMVANAADGDAPEKMPPKCTSPTLVEDEIYQRDLYYQGKGWIEGVEEMRPSIIVLRCVENPMRADIKNPVSVTPWNTQLLGDVEEVSA